MEDALDESRAFLRVLHDLGIRWTCVSAGSPYYNPHLQRPALFPPSDGYLPPEDPLVGVARQIRAGNIHVNGAGVDPGSPFGGYKQSGNVREFGVWGLEEFLETKAVLGYAPQAAE